MENLPKPFKHRRPPPKLLTGASRKKPGKTQRQLRNEALKEGAAAYDSMGNLVWNSEKQNVFTVVGGALLKYVAFRLQQEIR